jgi:hypothetical protein
MEAGMPEKTRELMSMAAECRELAELAKTETVREQLLESAAQFERLAEHLLKSRSPAPAH